MKIKLFIFIVLIYLLICLYYYPFLSDDSLISLRYVDRFIQGKGLNWTEGIPVEGYSNLSWVLLISLLGKLGMDLILAVRFAGILSGLMTILFIIYYYRKYKILPLTIGLLFLVLTPSFSVWSIGGLEQSIYVLLVVTMVLSVFKILDNTDKRKHNKYLLCLSFSLSGLIISRPDGALFSVITGVFFIFYFWNKKSFKIAILFIIKLFIIPIIFFLGQFLFRLHYYGELLPNTALVKTKITLLRVYEGIHYNKNAIISTFPFSLISIYFIGYLSLVKKNIKTIYLLALIICWLFYISMVGGDIFPAFRHFDLVIVLLVIGLLEGLYYFDFHFLHKRSIWLTLIIVFLGYIVMQYFNNENNRAKTERWEFIGLELGNDLNRIFKYQNPKLGVTAAGCIPYASKFPCLDMLGLNDYHIPRHPPINFGTGLLAHELGDPEYIMNSNLDIIIFNVGSKPTFNIGRLLSENYRFITNFKEVIVKTNEERPIILYMDIYSKKTGIKETVDNIKIPGYFFSNEKNNAYIKEDLKVYMSKFNSSEIVISKKIPGEWKVKSINNEKPDSKLIVDINNDNNKMKITIYSKENNFILKEIELERI
ncbi:hypothetical protein ETU10_01280 [Apibacter muscae]|uniref:hypothetical protein n=1 Tax=Apibacter muscae TaxID=2509004 RepID=UPI0011ACE273|nr:hypothetical protein [Apibacter muscae]TWP24622.1 hypothetical protein ETU10_01280 [Apibacter muscae]